MSTKNWVSFSRFILAWILGLGASACFADLSLPSDIAVTLSADKTTNLKAGDRITFTMTATNDGPQPLTYFSINGPHIFTEFNRPGLNWNDCPMLTDTGDTDFGPFWVLVWFPSGLCSENPVAPSEVRTCHFTLIVGDGLPANYTFTVGLGTYFSDTDSTNNTASVSLQRAIAQIPALSTFSLILLSFLLLGLAGQARLPKTV